MQGREKGFWTIESEAWRSLLRHALLEYPREACGMLLGPREKPGEITRSHPAPNRHADNPERRYVVDPAEFLAADRLAEREGLDICGFYHSHPDHPPSPSEHDLQGAWVDYLYLIISIQKGTFETAKAWVLDPGRARFDEVRLRRRKDEDGHEDASYPA